jgi:two-component system CheB/CheR fusion protein
VVAIGASAGGLEAVTQLLQNLAPDTGMAFIYVQHLSPDHKSLLTPLLSKVTKMKVQDIDGMEKIQPNNVYIIPYNKEIEVVDGHIQLLPRPANKRSNLSIDVLFASLAETHGENVVGVVLSGSANDGTRGLKEIKLAGGITFAQDDSAKFSSMPNSAIAEGVVDFVLSPKEIAVQLGWMSKHPLANPKAIKVLPEDEIENTDPHLKAILQLLQKTKRVDFSHYKMNTIKRRMLRRMLIHKIETLQEYANLLVLKNGEIELLYQDLLINVTEFFRDAEAFEFLKTSVLPQLLSSKTSGETLRVWVAACATGEEAFSIAMLLFELQEKKTAFVPFQIFASDLSAEAIVEARAGEYAPHQLKNISPKRLQKFFIKTNDKYRISKLLRDVCVFAHHNLLGDPPFSRMDFISCRNLLIYLDLAAQKKAIATFHYALNEGGCLMLGKSETIGTANDLFTANDKKFRIYLRKKNSGMARIPDIGSRITQPAYQNKSDGTTASPKKPLASPNIQLTNAYDAILLAQFVPASVIVNHEMEILQFRGNTAPYLQNASGKASFNILKMAHLEITFELRNAIHHAIKTKQTVRKTGIEMNRDLVGNTVRIVNLEVAPLLLPEEEPMLIVVFTGQEMELGGHPKEGEKKNTIAKDRRIKKLEEELTAARNDMRSITQDQETANEELQSANEEIISSNEELQSLNEELETSKEEIESTNEELITSNQELLARIQQVEELHNYNEAILDAVHEPMLVLDKNLRIKSANKSFCKTFKIIEEDVIGLSLFKIGGHEWNIPKLRELLEDILPKNNRFHDLEIKIDFVGIGQKIMLLNAHSIFQQSKKEELIVLTMIDATEVRRLAIEIALKEKELLNKALLESKNEQLKLEVAVAKRTVELKKQKEFSDSIIDASPDVIVVYDQQMRVLSYNKASEDYFNIPKEDILGKALFDLYPKAKEGRKYQNIRHALNGETVHDVFYHSVVNGKFYEHFFKPLIDENGQVYAAMSKARDITQVTLQQAAKDELIKAKNAAELKTKIAEDTVIAKQQFLSNMSHEIRTPMNAIIGFTNVILRTKLEDNQKDYILAIKESSDALLMLINDILDLAKVDSGKMIFSQTPFNLLDAVATMLLLFEVRIKEKNITLMVEYDPAIPTTLVGDPLRLRQIILNLVGNAVKFTSVGEISMRVWLLEQDAEKATIEFTLSDTGIGIAEDKLEQVFNNFEQVHKEGDTAYGGTGLGLAIVKQLIERQGGNIRLESELGKGTTFRFVLSFDKAKTTKETTTDTTIETTTETTTDTTTDTTTIKVLVAEDVILNQLLIKIIAEDFGFEVDIASNGKIAVEMLQQNRYDIVLMDLQMPVMNGFDATAYVRNQMKNQIPIIALTADVTSVDLDKCLAIGMNDYISKPIDEQLLYSKIMDCLKKN